jgi:hypothetical protein
MISFLCNQCHKISGRADDYPASKIPCDWCCSTNTVKVCGCDRPNAPDEVYHDDAGNKRTEPMRPMTLDEKYHRIVALSGALDTLSLREKDLTEFLDNELAYLEQRALAIAQRLKQIGVKP